MDNKFNNQGNVHIGKQIDNTNNKGQINIGFDNSKINATKDVDNRSLNGIDMKRLDEDLNNLEIKLAENKMYKEAGVVKSAIEAEKEKDKIDFLQKAGIKAFEIAQEISLPVATAAFAKILGVEI